MKCRKCGAPAAIHLRHHKLALCAPDYLTWFVEQTERIMGKYRMATREERILVAVSGGKDSLALWDVLLRLGYQADGLYINLGIDGGLSYSSKSADKARSFAAQHPEAQLHMVDIPALYGESIPEVARRRHRGHQTCSVCGLIKRHEMNRVALAEGYQVLATGHNLDDEAAVLFGNVLRWRGAYLLRQGPVLPAEAAHLACKIKPFCRFYERETAAYTLLRGIDYIYEECPFALGATSLKHKEVLTQMEHDAPGTKLHFYVSFLKAKEEGLFCQSEEALAGLHPCVRCGQPTLAPDLCAFCRLWEGD